MGECKILHFPCFGSWFMHLNVCVDLLQVIVKDFVSRAVIAHFRAHTSPISALCFDPSGTLLVTASIHGNNINIFRIMPSCSKNGAGSQNYNWTSSHVHLYKLHRGITSAVCSEFAFFLYYSFFLSKLFFPLHGIQYLELYNSYKEVRTHLLSCLMLQNALFFLHFCCISIY